MIRVRWRVVARVGGRRSGLTPFVVVSFVGHGVVVAAMLLWPHLGREQRVPEEVLFVDLAPLLPARASAAPPVAKHTVPPPAPVESGASLEQPPADPLPQIDPEPAPPPEPEEKPEPRRPRREAPVKERAAEDVPTPNGAAGLAGESAEVGSAEAGASIQALTAGDVEFAWYRASVTAALYSYWQRPILNDLRRELEVTVAFEILRDGRIGAMRIEVPSGVASLDRSALRAVSDAAPLPALPATWRDPSLPAMFVFRLFPESD